MRIQILIRLKPGVLDVQGKAVEHGLKEMGVSSGSQVRMGKLIELDVDGNTLEQARAQIDEACQKFLVNPIIETYEVRTA